jgi:putative transposase
MGVRNLVFAEGEYYHVYNRGVEKRKIFLDKSDHKRFTRLLYAANSTTEVHVSNYQGISLMEMPRGDTIVDIGAWCLMPNHFHLLLKEKSEKGISLFMKKLLTGYSMYFNAKNHRRGKLFEGKFSAKHLDSDNYLKYQYTYIHLNPVGIIERNWKEKVITDKPKTKKFLSSYPFSSYLDYVQNNNREESIILNKSAFPRYFQTFTEFNSMIDEWINFEEL